MQCPLKSLPVDSSLGQVGLEILPNYLLGGLPVRLQGEKAGHQIQEVGHREEAARSEDEEARPGEVADDVEDAEDDEDAGDDQVDGDADGRQPPAAAIRAGIRLGLGRHDGRKRRRQRQGLEKSDLGHLRN